MQGSSLVQFAYDAASRRTTLTLPNGVTTQYGYDSASRLTALTYTLAATVLGDLQYTYDAAGNRTGVAGTWARTSLPQPVAAATYNASNQQLTFGGQTLTYDLNGNLTGDGTSTYAWTARNQLAMITGPVPASFVYDGSGRRMRKGINGTVTDFLYDGVNPIQEVSGAAAASLLTGLGIDESFARTDTLGTSILLTDALGSTVALTDPAGGVQTQYTYEPFGATVTTGAASSNPFQYTGRENDGTGLYYYRARYYHPGLARFISEDPLGVLGDSVNLYPYALNNPLLWTDPFGLAVILQGKAGDWPNPVVVERLGQMSDRLGRDIIITGGKELRPKNPNSLHPTGDAADIKIPGMTSEEVAEEAVRSGFPGIIWTYDPGLGGHTHVEVGVPAYSGHNSATIRGPKPPWRIRGESGRSKSGNAAPPLPAQPACGTAC